MTIANVWESLFIYKKISILVALNVLQFWSQYFGTLQYFGKDPIHHK